MAKDASGKEGLSAGAIAKELAANPGQVKKALTDLGMKPDFVKAGCAYYYPERVARIKKALG